MLGSIALALRGTSPAVALSTIIAVLGIVGLFHVAFKGSGFFSVIFANAVGVYACLYIILIVANFPSAHPVSVQLGFVLPLAMFAAGVLGHRGTIQHILEDTPKHITLPFRGVFRWIGPLLMMAIATTYLRISGWSAETQDGTLLTSMAVIGTVAFLASKNIALFLMKCGSTFRDFLNNAVKLAQPAFALLTCYSMITIFFGSLYAIYDQAMPAPQFLINGRAEALTFPDGLYLSLSTLTTVGFGDIIAISPFARLLVSAEVLCGVLLLLFGVEAMLDRHRKP